MTNRKTKIGFGIIETIVAMGIFLIIVATAGSAMVNSQVISRLGAEETKAMFFAQEGLEAVRSIKNQAWGNLAVLGNGCSDLKTGGVTQAGGTWQWKDTPDGADDPRFTRNISISNVCRDGQGLIVESGGTYDENTKKISSTVNWNFIGSKINSLNFKTYLTDWRSAIEPTPNPINCLWKYIEVPPGASYQFRGNQDGKKVQTQGNYSYVVIGAAGNPDYDFAVMDIGTPGEVSLAGSLKFASQSADEFTNLAVSGNYAYASSKHNSKELVIIDIGNPAAPAISATLDIPQTGASGDGKADARGIAVSGNYVYLALDGAGDGNGEFISVNVTDPTNPIMADFIDLGGDKDGAREIHISSHYAFVASDDNDKELKVMDIGDPDNLILKNSGYNVGGNDDGLSIAGAPGAIFLGSSDNHIYIINASDPENINQDSLLSSYDLRDNVNDLAVTANNDYLMAVSDANERKEFQVLSITDLANPTLASEWEFNGKLMGVAFNADLCYAFAVGMLNLYPEFYEIITVPATEP